MLTSTIELNLLEGLSQPERWLSGILFMVALFGASHDHYRIFRSSFADRPFYRSELSIFAVLLPFIFITWFSSYMLEENFMIISLPLWQYCLIALVPLLFSLLAYVQSILIFYNLRSHPILRVAGLILFIGTPLFGIVNTVILYG